MQNIHYGISSGQKGMAKGRVLYITRRATYASRQDLVYVTHGNLPLFAADNPEEFFAAADHGERSNGAAYREHEIALPNELSLEQNIRLTHDLIDLLAGLRAFVAAIHAPIGSLSGEPHYHLHLMVSDRMPDGIERGPETMFARYNRAHPELGGCPKSSGGRSPFELKQELYVTRKAIADLINRALAAAGFNTRVDHRTLREQGSAVTPERYLGPARIKFMSEGEKAQFVNSRRDARLSD